MKKLLLASAVAALSITAAQAAPTVYGKVFLSLDIQDGNDAAKNGGLETRSQLNSNASRIGIKGSEALTANTDVVYQLEYRVETDVNRDRNWESRDTYLGLSNKQLGTLVAGRLTAIDEYINYANVTKGGVIGSDDVQAYFKSVRANNAFAYFSPKYNGVQFMGMYVLDENDGATDNLNGDAFGVGAKYEPENAPYKVGVTYIKASNGVSNSTTSTVPGATLDVTNGSTVVGQVTLPGTTTTTTTYDKLSAVRVSGAYAINPALTVAGQYQHTDFNTNDNENAFTVSGKYKVAQTPWTAYGQLDFVDNYAGAKDVERQRVVAGAEYSFNKATTAHLYGAYLQDKATGTQTEKAYGVGAGLEYKF
ncbi:porin [Moraxella sp. VT-16-12]|uniref:porin n=1 Tax=Moraxella sp. VT-16-12 TaxID=2014877 RepID=UPI000B7CDD66|nr:porin [Moraxella sp. VT-16-12]TWV83960.1 porin [Moraxella sp. VT-16-12]